VLVERVVHTGGQPISWTLIFQVVGQQSVGQGDTDDRLSNRAALRWMSAVGGRAVTSVGIVGAGRLGQAMARELRRAPT
jgi:lactate dehydrogenase-like 2-hydroxyacid dehydrogenase